MPANYGNLIQNLLLTAQKGDAKSQYRLGVMFNDGKGIKQDYSQAAKWYALAANQGHPKAQLYLGLLFQNGRGVKQNYHKAAQCFSRAAAQGDAKAQYCIGLLYLSGKGVEKNRDEAKKFFTLSKAQGNKQAAEAIAKLAKLEEAEKLAAFMDNKNLPEAIEIDIDEIFEDDDDYNEIFIQSVDDLLRQALADKKQQNARKSRRNKFKSFAITFLILVGIAGGFIYFSKPDRENEIQSERFLTVIPEAIHEDNNIPSLSENENEIDNAPPVNANENVNTPANIEIAKENEKIALAPVPEVAKNNVPDINIKPEEKIISQDNNKMSIFEAVKNKKIPGYIFERGKFTINPRVKNVIITGDGVRFRSEPNTSPSSRIFASLNNGFVREYCGEWVSPRNERWILSIYDKKNNIYGWIFAKYTKLQEE